MEKTNLNIYLMRSSTLFPMNKLSEKIILFQEKLFRVLNRQSKLFEIKQNPKFDLPIGAQPGSPGLELIGGDSCP